MSFRRIDTSLPFFYQKFLPSFFQNTIPEETVATCNNCPMLSDHGFDDTDKNFFSPESKCCTHYPNLSNYIVGGLLDSTDPCYEDGRQRMRKQISSRIEVTPHGILRPKKYHFLLTHTQYDYFGRSNWLICPYYDRVKGICTVRPYWNATCNTWFCKYTGGFDDRAFWLTLRKYLKSVEEVLTQYTLLTMGLDCSKIIKNIPNSGHLTVAELDDKPLSWENYRSLWGEWEGREEEFYRETFHIVKDLTLRDFERITGISHIIMLEELKKSYDTLMNNEPPYILKRNPKLQVKSSNEDFCTLIGYSPFDPVEIPRAIYEMLDLFDGDRTNDDVFALLLEKDKKIPTDDLLLSLYRLRILITDEDEQ
ncbi:MAG: hypothetical protein JXB48_23015 [Candidatus Latescibacteria bacterium]|nr:hypothetical protein [Candidatus Latescibacterota bacterium]